MYLIKAKAPAPGYVSKYQKVNWATGDIREVEDSEYPYYLENSSVFTILAGPTLARVGVNGRAASAYIDFNAASEALATITINGVVYTEADTAVPATGVFTNGASAADSATSLLAALNGDLRATVPFTAVADLSGDGVWLFWDGVGTAGNVTITTTSASNCTVQNSTGGEATTAHDSIQLKHTVNTQELLSGAIEIPVPFTPTGFHITATTSAGAPVYFTDKVTIKATPNRIRIDTDGATNLANTNIVYLTAFN